MRMNPYLLFSGQCREAFQLYEKALGGKIVFMLTNGESPMADQTPPERRDQVMHATLNVGSAVLMGSDAPPEHYTKPAGFSVTLNPEDPADAERLFKALSDGGTVKMPLQKT